MRFFRKYLLLIIGLIYAGGFYSFISETNINQEGNYFSPNDMAGYFQWKTSYGMFLF